MAESASDYPVAFLLCVLGVVEFTSDAANIVFAVALVTAGSGMAVSVFSQQRGNQSFKKSADTIQVVSVAAACLALLLA